jgi:hypothetical protein
MRRLLSLPLVFAAGLAFAQEGAQNQPLPAVPPPPPEMEPLSQALDEGPRPEVSIRQDERGTVTEYRIGGKLYMAKITPDKGVPYYLVDTDGDGALETRYATEDNIVVPMWVIGTF